MKFTKPFEIRSTDGLSKRFSESDRFAEWVHTEHAFWRPIAEALAQAKLFKGLLDLRPLTDAMSQLESALNHFQADVGSRLSDYETGLQNAIAKYEEVRVPFSSSPTAQAINNLFLASPDAALVKLLEWREGRVTHRDRQNAQLVFGDIQSVQDFFAAKRRVDAAHVDMQAKIAEQSTSLDDLRSQWVAQLNEHNDLFETATEGQRRKAIKLRRLGMAILRKQKVLCSEHHQEMKRMEQAFSTEMRLRASEKFWSSKRRLNRKRSISARSVFFAIAGVGGVLLILWAVVLAKFAIPTGSGFDLGHTIYLLVPFVIYVWLLRMFGTEYRTNKNMADDAEEREAMVMTFKALEFEERAKPEERLVILNALFRPHGAQSEESIPLPIWEAVVAKLSK